MNHPTLEIYLNEPVIVRQRREFFYNLIADGMEHKVAEAAANQLDNLSLFPYHGYDTELQDYKTLLGV
jgi:hypothetical protein